MSLQIRSGGPHHGQPVLGSGAPLGMGRAVGILVHGRGATADGMLELAAAIGHPDVTWLAPQAADDTWYPNRFLAPIASNEPWLSSALAAIGDVLSQAEEAGVTRDRIALVGFSQGGCLVAEYLIRHPTRLKGLAALSGGLIGPPGTAWPVNGRFDGVPVFFGCSDIDSHIPKERVIESADVFRQAGADVTATLYPGMGHTINADELQRLRTLFGS